MNRYDTIIVGAGASGLYCANFLEGGKNLILEGGKRPGLKLLMAGSGQCNITHGGSIKDFIDHYGDHGKSIRGILQRHNNIELCRFLSKIGVPVYEREDGKIFPKSMDSKDVLNALLENVNGDIAFETVVEFIETSNDGYIVSTQKGQYKCDNLVIAVGGASYPSTGSNGMLAKTITHGLSIDVVELRLSLTPVYVQDYPYIQLSGISFSNVKIQIGNRTAVGDILFTHKNLSGPVIINSSRYAKAGDELIINYLWPMSMEELLGKLKKDFPGNSKSLQNYLVDEFSFPKRFANHIVGDLCIEGMKVSQLSGEKIKELALEIAAKRFTISGVAGFKEAMATAGGISLSEISTKTMETKNYPGLYFIGEVLDVDGDTGGYNLQFAYSSARTAAEHINEKNMQLSSKNT